jgi:hypothetical protein
MAQRNGTGMFPREVMNRFPLLPLEEEGGLMGMGLRGFSERVQATQAAPQRATGDCTAARTEMLDREPTPASPGSTPSAWHTCA